MGCRVVEVGKEGERKKEYTGVSKETLHTSCKLQVHVWNCQHLSSTRTKQHSVFMVQQNSHHFWSKSNNHSILRTKPIILFMHQQWQEEVNNKSLFYIEDRACQNRFKSGGTARRKSSHTNSLLIKVVHPVCLRRIYLHTNTRMCTNPSCGTFLRQIC